MVKQIRLFLCQGITLRVPFLWVQGMALYPFILHRAPTIEGSMLTHERIHLQQQLEMGIVPFYIWYIVEYAFRRAQRTHHHAYMVLAHEQEAYENDYNPRYLTERRSYSWLQFV